MVVVDSLAYERSEAAADTRRRIIVLGAGYVGLTTAIRLGRRPDCQVVLVDRSDAHELKPKIPEAIGEWTDCSVHSPIADVLREKPVTLFQTTVTGLDPVKHEVLTEAGSLPYWRLVVALGARAYLAPAGISIPGLAEVGIAPYSQGAACRLRHLWDGKTSRERTSAMLRACSHASDSCSQSCSPRYARATTS